MKDSLLLPLKEEVSKTIQECQSVVPFHARSAQSLALITNEEMTRQQTSFFGRLEDAIRKHERVCNEKAQLEENIKVKEQENEELKAELNSLKHVDGGKSMEQLESTVSRIAACEADVSELREKVKELQSIIEEQSMLIKRGKSTMKQGLMTLSHVAKKEITSAKESAEKKETEYKVQLLEAKRGEEELVKEKQKVEEELRAKVQALEHKVALQEKDLQIKDLEINYQRQLDSTRLSPLPHVHLSPLSEKTVEVGIGDIPTIVKLLSFKCSNGISVNIAAEINTDYPAFAAQLLNDDTGARLRNIERANLKDPKEINIEILREWLKGGERRPVTWSALARVLENIGKGELAAQIKQVKSLN